MDIKAEKECSKLRELNSADAVDFLIDVYPSNSVNYGQVFDLLNRRSWKKADQIKLARYYFKRLPFASAKPYEVFSSFMSLHNFINVLKEFLPADKSDLHLLKYHVEPILRKCAKSEKEEMLVGEFLSSLE